MVGPPSKKTALDYEGIAVRSLTSNRNIQKIMAVKTVTVLVFLFFVNSQQVLANGTNCKVRWKT